MSQTMKKRTDLEIAKDELAKGEYTCVLCLDGRIRTSKKRGVVPLVEWLSNWLPTKHASAADKVVGKAPAMMYVLMGVSSVYAHVMTAEAVKIMEDAGIEVSFDEEVEKILNDKRDDTCPVEKLVADMDEPVEALGTIRQILGI